MYRKQRVPYKFDQDSRRDRPSCFRGPEEQGEQGSRELGAAAAQRNGGPPRPLTCLPPLLPGSPLPTPSRGPPLQLSRRLAPGYPSRPQARGARELGGTLGELGELDASLQWNAAEGAPRSAPSAAPFNSAADWRPVTHPVRRRLVKKTGGTGRTGRQPSMERCRGRAPVGAKCRPLQLSRRLAPGYPSRLPAPGQENWRNWENWMQQPFNGTLSKARGSWRSATAGTRGSTQMDGHGKKPLPPQTLHYLGTVSSTA